MKNHKEILKATPTLASRLYKRAKNTKSPLTWAQALSYAYYTLKEEMKDFKVIETIKKSGEKVKAVVSDNIAKYYTFKGAKRKDTGLSKFIDASKIAFNIIYDKKIALFFSCYQYKILT